MWNFNFQWRKDGNITTPFKMHRKRLKKRGLFVITAGGEVAEWSKALPC
jgi:hypothetical protein